MKKTVSVTEGTTFLNMLTTLHLVKFVREVSQGSRVFFEGRLYLILGRPHRQALHYSGGGRGSVSEVTHQRCHTLAPPPGNVYPDKYTRLSPEHRISVH